MNNNKKEILFVNSYAEPNPIGSNNTPVASAIALKKFGYDVTMLTVTTDPTWKGPVPDDSSPLLGGLPHIRIERHGIKYIIVKTPSIWGDRYQTEDEWNDGVNWAISALRELRPTLVHQWVWQQVSYLLTAAVRLHLPTIYSAQDYGLLCQRTLLITGKNQICDGIINEKKCSKCVFEGRNYIGKLNEIVLRLPLASYLINKIYKIEWASGLRNRNVLRTPITKRTNFKFEQAYEIAKGVDAIQVSSKLGYDLFMQFGAPENKIFTVPWFHDHKHLCERLPADSDIFTLAYVGRIAPYKGLEVLLDSLRFINTKKTIILKIAGKIDSDYGMELKKKYGEKIGKHSVEWIGWIDKNNAFEFYDLIHAVVVPSQCLETGPRTLIEALAHRRPVITTDLPSMNTFIEDGVNGLLFPASDSNLLASCISKLSENRQLLEFYSRNCINVPSINDFVGRILSIYNRLLNKEKL